VTLVKLVRTLVTQVRTLVTLVRTLVTQVRTQPCQALTFEPESAYLGAVAEVGVSAGAGSAAPLPAE
jgi:hypothetical protein